MIITGRVTKITYYNQENGYGVVRIEVSNEEMNRILSESGYDELYTNYLTVVSMFTSLPLLDTDYEFSGDFEENKYGLQFRSDKTVKASKQSEDGIVKYLSSGMFKGIGIKTAKKIYDKLGPDTLKKIIEDKDNLNGLGIKAKNIDTIYNTLKQSYDEEQSTVELLSYGISLSMATRIMKTLGEKALRTVTTNPYALIEKVEGIGFLRADDIAMKVGIKKDDPYRLKALIMYVLSNVIYNNGDTFMKLNDLYLECIKVTNKEESILSKEKFKDLIDELVELKKIVVDDDQNVYEVLLSHQESDVARFVLNILKDDSFIPFNETKILKELKEVESHNNITYSDKQKEAIINALTQPISIVTGGPGTGKSTIIKGIIEVYTHMFPTDKQDVMNMQIALAAPTGRAAKRLREVTNHASSTIHKLLGYTGHSFTVEQIEAKLIIVDEFSMVDISLAYHLFKSIAKNTIVVIVGDSDQLPAVGAGDILNDLILSKEITTTRLDKIHRQAQTSTIINLAHTINENRLPYDILDKQHDRCFIKCLDESIINGTIKSIEAYLSKFKKEDYNSFDEIAKLNDYRKALINEVQVLVPMYRGSVGIDAFNFYLQDYFNPLTKDNYKQIKIGTKRYRKYDKVIQLINRSDKDIMNGDIGYISKIDGDNNQYNGLYVTYPIGEVYYEMDELEEISLAYAISIHKAQGSEFDMVITPFSFKYYIMLKKKLIYTAITRAKKYLIMIGNFDALRKGILQEEEKRKTKLQEKIKKLIDNPNAILDESSAFDEIRIENEIGAENGDNDFLSPYDFM